MQLKTSTKISLKFTLFATVILLIFSVVIFILFFGTRYSKQKERLHINKAYQPPMLLTTIISNVSPGEPQPLFTRNIKKDETTKNAIIISKNAVHLPLTNATPTEIPLEELSEKNGYYLFNFLSFISQGQITIFYKGGNYFTYTIQYDKVKFLDITGFMYAQMELTQLLLFRDICFIVIVYLLSLYFVKSSLKNLKRLTTYVQNLNIERPTVPLTVQGHKYDEIRVISDAFNSFTKKIHSQVQTLKDFIANASHELKTPLMMINTEIDIALKKQDYTDRLLTIKENIKRLSSLLDTLSLITRLENATTIEKESINLAEKTQTIVQEIERMYPKKNILIDIPAEITLQAHA
jgi:signal transduction histidine kinase